MKLNEDARFPHPVLSLDTADYSDGEFSIGLSVSEQVNAGEVTLDHDVVLTQGDLRQLVANHAANVGVFVVCQQTYYSALIPLGLEPGRFTFDHGRLAGRVNLRPMVWTSRPVNSFPLDNAHPEFGGGSTDFAGGTVLALGDELSLFVGHEKLAQMDSIFTISKSDELPPSTLSVFLDEPKVKILVAPDIYETLNRMRDVSAGKPTVLNGVYLPAVMQILDIIRDGGGAQYEGLRWYTVFDAKCAHYRINLQDPDLWKDAQTLLQSPFVEIHRNSSLYG